MKQTLTLTTFSGKKLAATIEKRTVIIGLLGECDPVKEKRTITNIFIKIDGKNVEFFLQYCGGYTGKIVEKCAEANVKYFLNCHVNGERFIIILSVQSLKQIMNIIGKTDENFNKIIETANEILEESKTTIKNSNGTLMNKNQAKEYIKKYNDFYNEGGEGYTPRIVTAEQLEWAKSIIGGYNHE